MLSKGKVQVEVTHVGCGEATAYARQHHARFKHPGGEVFALAMNHDTPDVTYGVVSVRDNTQELYGIEEVGDLALKASHLEAFERVIRREALDCGLKAPFSITMITKNGICSRPVRRLRRPTQKGAA